MNNVLTVSREHFVLGAAAAAGALLAGCGSGGSAVVPRAGPASKVTAAYNKAGFTCEAALFIAEQHKYFRDEGLELAVVDLSGTPEVEMVKGNVDLTEDPAWALVAPLLPQGVQVGDVVATAGLQRGSSCICVAADSTIRTAADLRGQKVAAGLRWRFMFGQPLSDAGVSPITDIDWQPALPPGAVAEALRSKTVAAAQVHQPYAAAVESSGAGRMLLMQNMPPLQDDYCCSVIVPSKLVREDRPKAAAITRAMMRGASWVRAHPVESAQLEIDAKYVTASVADNGRGMAALDFFPSVDVARGNTLDVLRRFKRLGFLDAATDENALLARLFVPVT